MNQKDLEYLAMIYYQMNEALSAGYGFIVYFNPRTQTNELVKVGAPLLIDIITNRIEPLLKYKKETVNGDDDN